MSREIGNLNVIYLKAPKSVDLIFTSELVVQKRHSPISEYMAGDIEDFAG